MKADPVYSDVRPALPSAPVVRPLCVGLSGPSFLRRSLRRGFGYRARRLGSAAAMVTAPSEAACMAGAAGLQGASQGTPAHRGLLPRMPPPPAAWPPPTLAKPWHLTGFIPEMRLDNKIALEAFRRHVAYPKVAVLNYLHLPACMSASSIRSKLGLLDALVLSCVGPDRALDRLSIERYDAAARTIGADAVVSPDDYIYACDDAHEVFQGMNLIRARKRALALLDMRRRPYSVIGLVAGRNKEQIRGSLEFLRDHGMRDCAFPCGDYLKGGRRADLIAPFVRQASDLRMWGLLLGVGWTDLLPRLGPPCFSNSEVCFGPAHDRAAKCRALDLPPGHYPPPASSLDRHLACLDRNHALAGALGR